MNAVLNSSQKDLRTMNSKRLAVFAASMQWADAVKVVSRGTPRSRTSVTWGIRWSVSAVENDRESGGRFPTVRHAHLLGLIGRSHFEESEDRRFDDQRLPRKKSWRKGRRVHNSEARTLAGDVT